MSFNVSLGTTLQSRSRRPGCPPGRTPSVECETCRQETNWSLKSPLSNCTLKLLHLLRGREGGREGKNKKYKGCASSQVESYRHQGRRDPRHRPLCPRVTISCPDLCEGSLPLSRASESRDWSLRGSTLSGPYTPGLDPGPGPENGNHSRCVVPCTLKGGQSLVFTHRVRP